LQQHKKHFTLNRKSAKITVTFALVDLLTFESGLFKVLDMQVYDPIAVIFMRFVPPLPKLIKITENNGGFTGPQLLNTLSKK
jgi:hypothetical protein